MNKSITLAVASAALLLAGPAVAQDQAMTTAEPGVAVPAAAPSAMLVTDENPNRLPAGSRIVLRTLEPLTTKGKKLKVGQRVRLEVAESVLLNGATVIPTGTPGVAEITDVRNKGMWGKSGALNGRIVSITLNGRTIRMSGQFNDKGSTGTGGVVASVVLLPLAGFFTTGTSATLEAGTNLIGFLDEDLTFNIK